MADVTQKNSFSLGSAAWGEKKVRRQEEWKSQENPGMLNDRLTVDAQYSAQSVEEPTASSWAGSVKTSTFAGHRSAPIYHGEKIGAKLCPADLRL